MNSKSDTNNAGMVSLKTQLQVSYYAAGMIIFLAIASDTANQISCISVPQIPLGENFALVAFPLMAAQIAQIGFHKLCTLLGCSPNPKKEGAISGGIVVALSIIAAWQGIREIALMVYVGIFTVAAGYMGVQEDSPVTKTLFIIFSILGLLMIILNIYLTVMGL